MNSKEVRMSSGAGIPAGLICGTDLIGVKMRCSQLFDSIISRCAPILHLHHGETYFPSSVEWFIERCELLFCPSGVDSTRLKDAQLLVPAGCLTQERLLEIQASMGSNSCKLQLHLPSREHFKGQPLVELDDVPVYAHVKLVMDDLGQLEAYEINYCMFYPYNGAYNLFHLPCFQAGAHIGDWEHLTVRLDPASLAVQAVWYNSHRNIEGEWRPGPQAPTTRGGRLAAYVARHGHGTYPTAGTICRLFCAANDVTSSTGPVWRPKKVVLMCGLEHGQDWPQAITRGSSFRQLQTLTPTTPTTPLLQPGERLPEVVLDMSPWQRFRGYFGTAQAPCCQGWFMSPEPPCSRGWFNRLFLPLAKGIDKLPRQGRGRFCEGQRSTEDAHHDGPMQFATHTPCS